MWKSPTGKSTATLRDPPTWLPNGAGLRFAEDLEEGMEEGGGAEYQGSNRQTDPADPTEPDTSHCLSPIGCADQSTQSQNFAGSSA